MPTTTVPTTTVPTTTVPTTIVPTTTIPTTIVPTTTVPTTTVPTTIPTMIEPIAPIISPNFSQNMSDQIQIQPPLAEPFQQPSQAFPKFEFKDVPYGCLRGGNKPTYRTYHRNQNVQLQNNHNTTLKRPLFGHTVSTEPQNVDPIIQERQRKLREIQENNHIMRQEQTTLVSNETNETAQHAGAIQPTKIKKEIKQTITKKYKLGKTPNGKVVGVLIKNSDTRRRIQEEHGILRRESIVEIRKYLHDHGLIKVGSDAPPDVLRNIYESAKMTGEVNNTNKHVMLHNFMKSDENTVNA